MASYSKKHLAYVVVRNIFFVLLIIAAFMYLYKPVETQLNERKALRDKYSEVYQDVLNFPALNDSMQETKAKIEDSIASIPMDYSPNQVLLSQYRDRVYETAKSNSVKITSDTVNRNEATSEFTSLLFEFNAKYAMVYKFLFSLELFSRVNSFSIDEKNNVTVESQPVLYRPEVDNYFSGREEVMDEVRMAGYFKEIFEKSAKLLESLGHIPTWRDIDPAPRNPFYEYKAPYKASVNQRRKLPEIKISGIIYDVVNPIVIIEGKLYRQGDYYKTVKILTIRERTITVELDGQKYIIKFDKGEVE